MIPLGRSDSSFSSPFSRLMQPRTPQNDLSSSVLIQNRSLCSDVFSSSAHLRSIPSKYISYNHYPIRESSQSIDGTQTLIRESSKSLFSSPTSTPGRALNSSFGISSKFKYSGSYQTGQLHMNEMGSIKSKVSSKVSTPLSKSLTLFAEKKEIEKEKEVLRIQIQELEENLKRIKGERIKESSNVGNINEEQINHINSSNSDIQCIPIQHTEEIKEHNQKEKQKQKIPLIDSFDLEDKYQRYDDINKEQILEQFEKILSKNKQLFLQYQQIKDTISNQSKQSSSIQKSTQYQQQKNQIKIQGEQVDKIQVTPPYKETVSLEHISLLRTTNQTTSFSSFSSPFHNNNKLSPKFYQQQQRPSTSFRPSFQLIDSKAQSQQIAECSNVKIIEETSPIISVTKRNNSMLFSSSETQIEELERVIGVKNQEIQDLKDKLYEAKDQLIQHFPSANRQLTLFTKPNIPQKRRKSFSSSQDLLSFSDAINKRMQNNLMEWSFSIELEGGINSLLKEGWEVTEKSSNCNLSELKQVIGVVGMPCTGKTTIINGLMKGSLQSVEEDQKSEFFKPRLHIAIDENLGIFEYTLRQPENTLKKDKKGKESVEKETKIIQSTDSQSKGNKQQNEEDNRNNNEINQQLPSHQLKLDDLWLEFFFEKTPILLVVLDKFTGEEQRMLQDFHQKMMCNTSLQLKELIIIHNYSNKGLKSREQLQEYFGEALFHIDSNFKSKSIVDLKMYRTILVQQNTKSKKCINITHLLNGNFFEPFVDKYQHNTLSYLMDKLSQTTTSSTSFFVQFESYLTQKLLREYENEDQYDSASQQYQLAYCKESKRLCLQK